ncbi:MAG: hypothetical protein JWQ79_2502 [Mucilaginibacter sp.]|nr:hypothetical protein [Mucilaginibacter sp.]
MKQFEHFGTVEKEVIGHPEIGVGAKTLYSLLCCFKNSLDECFPSNALLANHLGCSEKTISRYFKELFDWGITTRRQTGYDSRYITKIHHAKKFRKFPNWSPYEGRQISLPNMK